MNVNNEINIFTSGKYSDFKKSEYNLLMARIIAINKAMTHKCRRLSLIPLETTFSFNFVFKHMHEFLNKIEDYDKKPRKDNLQKWWMNKKTSEMALNCLPSILDRIEEMSKIIGKQEQTELMSSKFEEYIKYELLECAFKLTFRRTYTKGSTASVFPSTAFQYKRSRLRQKLDNKYFIESELINMNANSKKKKEEWVKLIEQKRKQCEKIYCKDKVQNLMQCFTRRNNNKNNSDQINLHQFNCNMVATNITNPFGITTYIPSNNSKKRKANDIKNVDNKNVIMAAPKVKKQKLDSDNKNVIIKNVNQWTLNDVLNWFTKIGYEKYISKLRPQFIED
eukprot:533988_1